MIIKVQLYTSISSKQPSSTDVCIYKEIDGVTETIDKSSQYHESMLKLFFIGNLRRLRHVEVYSHSQYSASTPLELYPNAHFFYH